MNQLVTLKGTRSGIIVVLDENASFDVLKLEVARKFEEASAFLGKNNMGLVFRGKTLTEEQENELVKTISEYSNIAISCVIDEKSALDRIFEEDKKEAEGSTQEAVAETVDPSDAFIVKGDVIPGHDVSNKKSIIVLGDVKPGASVTSSGNIFILGELRGNAFAGCDGDKSCIIVALKMEPLEVKIADAIAISPEAEKGPKLKKKKRLFGSSADTSEPEVAYFEKGHIVQETYGHQFLRNILSL